MKPIFCGNFEYDARQSELERLFKRYGKVDRVDMKSEFQYVSVEPTESSPTGEFRRQRVYDIFICLVQFVLMVFHISVTGFAFVYMEDERDAEDAIRGLDRTDFGRRRLRVEWTKQDRGGRQSGSSRRSSTNTRPTKTLFVINFDQANTRPSDLEKHFEPHGKILNVRIRKNFAFIQFESQEDATRALEATNMSTLMDRVISVEYSLRDDDERNGHSPDRRVRDRSPDRRGRERERERSRSPYGRGVERASPDYGRGPSPYSKPEQRGSPEYARAESPAYERQRSRSPPRQESS